MYDQGKIAAVLGVFNGLVIGIQSAFAFGSTAQFQRTLAGAAVRLRSDLQVRVTTQAEFSAVYDAFNRLRDRADSELPQGEGMAATKVMYESLKRTAGPQKPPCTGQSYRQIGRQLDISKNTVLDIVKRTRFSNRHTRVP